MKTQDTRRLSPSAQQAIRHRAVAAVHEHGLSVTQAALTFGVARQTLSRWLNRFRRHGADALRSRRRGATARELLSPAQARQLLDAITQHTPAEFGLYGQLWTRAAVAAYARRQLGIDRSRWVWGRWLKRHGLTPQRPSRRAVKQDPEAVARWLQREYPELVGEAEEDEAEIHWLDEAGLRSDCAWERGYAPRGQTPTTPVSGQRFRVNYLAVLSNRGAMRFLVYTGWLTAALFLTFLGRLLADRRGKKVYLILDRHPAHVSQAVAAWVAARAGRIRLVFLPAYSPELNPVEYFNHDVKANAQRHQKARDKHELEHRLNEYLEATAAEPEGVRDFFQAEPVKYAA